MKLLECVPNFSEGQNDTVLKELACSIEKIKGVRLLDVDTGYHANRSVFTFAGEPQAVVEAAFQSIRIASENIDMRKHKGEHPRIGATDVCPLIPIKGMDMEEAIFLSKQLGQRVSEELKIPVYLYEKSASVEERKNLAWLRKGEYEGLSEKLKNENFIPDFGEPSFNPQSGICIIGTRNILIAFNINLNTKDPKAASQIAEQIRESGYNGKKGSLKNVKAIGWYIKEFDKVQISMNLTDYRATPIHSVFEEVKQKSNEKGIIVTGSELVGMIPLDALTVCGEHFLKENAKRHHLPHTELIEYAVQYLGLNEVKPFDANKKVIELAMNN